MRSPGWHARVLLVLTAWATLAVRGTSSEPSPSPVASKEGQRVLERFPLAQRRTDLILVPVEVQGKVYRFCVDTGVSRTVLDTSLSRDWGEAIREIDIDTQGSKVAAETFRAPAIRVGHLTFPDQQDVIVSDLGDMRKTVSNDIRGFLGMDFLRNYIVQLDFDRREILFLAPDTKPLSEWGCSTPMEIPSEDDGIIRWRIFGLCIQLTNKRREHLPHDVPIVWVSTPDKGNQMAMMVDTGMQGGLTLESELFDRLMTTRHIRPISLEFAMTFGGTVCELYGDLDRFRMKEFEHPNLTVHRGNGNCLGLDYLSRYRVTLDFPHGKMYLARGRSYADKNREIKPFWSQTVYGVLPFLWDKYCSRLSRWLHKLAGKHQRSVPASP